MPHHPERRAAERQMNTARHVADARADARRLREVIESLAILAGAGQLPAVSDLQAALALARITEFHAARAERSITEESLPCL